uniref:EF-hand domain-containing protein n=1 Tax=Alexandrium monilatum TaxID=311494 RepID=A0A7S4WCJ3_9DINO
MLTASLAGGARNGLDRMTLRQVAGRDVRAHKQSKRSAADADPDEIKDNGGFEFVTAAMRQPEARPSSAAPQEKWPGGGEFPHMLAQQAAELCRRLATEREMHLSQLHSLLVEERDRLKAENLRLTRELASREPNKSIIRGRSTFHEALFSSRSRSRSRSPSEPKDARAPATSVSASPRSMRGEGRGSPPREERHATDVSLDIEDSPGVEEGLLDLRNIDRSSVAGGGSLMSAEAQGSDLFLLRKVYKALDRRHVGLVNAKDIAAEMGRITGCRLEDRIPALTLAIKAVNKALVAEQLGISSMASGGSDLSNGPIATVANAYPSELTFEGFKFLIIAEDIDFLVTDETAAGAIHEVREFYVKWTAESVILERTRVGKEELAQEMEVSPLPVWLEPVIGIIICLNALCIGLSQDLLIDHIMWTIFEIIFSVCFLVELLIKVRCFGCIEHFFGEGFLWSWFDFAIVIIAVADLLFTVLSLMNMEGLPDLNRVTILRLVRIVRMARIVRLLRMKLFKELTLMVYGVIGGLRTLCWAFVFLFVIVFIIGVFMKQVFDLSLRDCSQSEDKDSATCTHSETVLWRHHEVLFSSVFRSMFTVFRCLIGDCNSPDGMPLAPHLMSVMGSLFTIGYVVLVCFVIFGVFNLVMAIFVENTLETARVSQQKRQQARTKEHVRVAQELRQIVLRICTRMRNKYDPTSTTNTASMQAARRTVWDKVRSSVYREPDSRREASMEEETMQMAVSREVFEEVLQDPKVALILEDLEISITDRAKLFDIIDANGSGHLDVGEIIEGLMKLRGPADKGDVVCAALMVRSVQREIERLDLEMQERHRALQETQIRILSRLRDPKGIEQPKRAGVVPEFWRCF